MTKIFGVDPEGKVTPSDVRNAMLECFYQAHCQDSEIEQGGEELTREYCEQIVKKAFQDTGGDFDKPNKEALLKVMGELSEFSKNFREDEVIRQNYMKINTLVQKL